MTILNTFVFIIACVTLFLYGLQSFSREIQSLAVGPLQKGLQVATTNRWVAALTGAIATALLQSSSAVSTLAIVLKDTGLLKLPAVLAVMIGANIGTASTAFLVSFKIQGMGAIVLVLGALLSLLPIRIRVLGKTIFYFGLIFFALEHIQTAIQPLQSEPWVIEWLRQADHIFIGVGAGILLTALLQSSSVVVGIVVLLASQGMITLGGAIAVMLGANIGTTATAFFASFAMGKAARVAALANIVFNVLGVLFFMFFVPQIEKMSSHMAGDDLGLAVAYSNLIFNAAIGIFFLLILTYFVRLLKSK